MAPRCLLTWSLRVLFATGPLAVLVLVGWVAGLFSDEQRTTVLMAYNLLLLVSTGAGCTACVAGVQLAIHSAFAAGFKTGQASVWPGDQDTQPTVDPLLRLVDGGK